MPLSKASDCRRLVEEMRAAAADLPRCDKQAELLRKAELFEDAALYKELHIETTYESTRH